MTSLNHRSSGHGTGSVAVGLIPAAGCASRLGGFPCSKEILPIGYPPEEARKTSPAPPRLASHGLLEAYRLAGVDTAYVALGDGKWDVPAALGDGGPLGPKLCYVPVAGSRSVPESLDRLHPFVGDRDCVMGFPDVWFRPADAFDRLLAARARSGAEVALGCFPTDRPQRTDMVELAEAEPGETGETSEVLRIEVRPASSELRYNWLLAAWGPAFSALLHRHVAASADGTDGDGSQAQEELQLGEIFRRALAAGMTFTAVPFPGGTFTDLGTPGELAEAWRRGHPLAD